MPGKYKCPISALIITAVATLGYWNYALTTLSNGKNSKRYLQLRRQSGANSIVSTDTCGFDWLVDGLDTKIYETEKFNAKWNMDKRQAVKKDIRQITKPLIEHPMYLMDPNRYLLPVLEGGPNNQVFCLRETIFIAIKLNRTLVIPRFIKHFTDR